MAAEVEETQLRVVKRGPTILSLGRLVRYKGHHRVIEALPHLLKVDPTINLLILGQGPYGAKLRKLAERLGVSVNTVEYRLLKARKTLRSELLAEGVE